MTIEKIASQSINTITPIVKKNAIQKTMLKTLGSDKPSDALMNTLDMISSKRKALIDWVPKGRITVSAKNEASAQREIDLIHDALSHGVPMDRAQKGARAVIDATGELSGKSAKESAIVFNTLIENGFLKY